jgi:hypothetical protein
MRHHSDGNSLRGFQARSRQTIRGGYIPDQVFGGRETFGQGRRTRKVRREGKFLQRKYRIIKTFRQGKRTNKKGEPEIPRGMGKCLVVVNLPTIIFNDDTFFAWL